MSLFAPAVAFVDLETTGTRAARDRITEIGIVRVERPTAGAPPRVEEWSSLVDPGVPIPPAIQAMTGITNAMVRSAPTFSTLLGEVRERLAGCVFVAHNARFDYGFLKHEFARLERPFSAKVLCTVKLSRRLYPQCPLHNLDAVIARHALPVDVRHRALADARALWLFVQALYAELPSDGIETEVHRILRTPSLPPQLSPDAIDAIPDGPGVYLFYGENPLPLYIGKSRNLRDRVAAHFSGDWRSETDLRLSAEIRRIEFQATAGEIGALIREATLVKSLLPAHNRALRCKSDAGVLRIEADGALRFVHAAMLDLAELTDAYGPFSSRRAMRESLAAHAREHALCWNRLGVQRRDGPCFARQLKRCAGLCDGSESLLEHDARLRSALAPLAIPRWPFAGAALIREHSIDTGCTEVHVLRDWCWLGTARDDVQFDELLAFPPRAGFDPDITRLLTRLWRRRPSLFVDARRRR